MSIGGRPNLPLDAEPVLRLDAGRVTDPVAIGRQPVAHRFALEEEPVLRFSPAAPTGPALDDARPSPDAGRLPPRPTAPPLPATGPALPTWAGVLAIAGAALLRRRDRPATPSGPADDGAGHDPSGALRPGRAAGGPPASR